MTACALATLLTGSSPYLDGAIDGENGLRMNMNISSCLAKTMLWI